MMRLHKENTTMYQPFYKSLQDLAAEEETPRPGVSFFNYSGSKSNVLLEKYSHMFQNLISFEKDTEKSGGLKEITDKLNVALKRILPVKDASLLFFDEAFHKLIPADKNLDSEVVKVMNHYYREGILNIIYETGKPVVVPELASYNSDGPKLSYILFPILENGRRQGLLSILSSITQSKLSDLDKQIIQILLNTSLAKINKFRFKEKLYTTYEELQTYQAKLSNDFRLSAIGEMTEGIVEDIITPLQVIMSRVDLLDVDQDQEPEIKAIKTQIGKVNSVINRLVKFASVNQKNIKIHPCKVNEVVTEYYSLVKSTLENLNIECVLDFEENVPPILSHPNYVFQLLTNVIGLIKSENKNNGGIIIQTRYKSDNIIIKVVTTSRLKSYAKNYKAKGISSDLNVRIIDNLMNKHEGDFTIESFDNSGAAITLKFPLRRRIRE